jgi:hypothetical protein
MGITDELRKWKSEHSVLMGGIREFDEMLDRIDAEHQKSMDGWKARNGQMWLKGYSECRAEIAEGNDAIAHDLEANGWVRLPLDADGVPIHIGDYLHCDETGRDFPCRGYCCSVGKNGERQWTVECSYDAYSGTSEYVSARRCHHASTVEDVLREFADEVQRCCDTQDTIAEFAARLRLAEEDK